MWSTHLPCILKIMGLNLDQIVQFPGTFSLEISRIVAVAVEFHALCNTCGR
uniref:Uncharacterized protein n=1 Tax=Arion vulgaris TaxID=1028688 RepID=A0A0B7B711_9EUPU